MPTIDDFESAADSAFGPKETGFTELPKPTTYVGMGDHPDKQQVSTPEPVAEPADKYEAAAVTAFAEDDSSLKNSMFVASQKEPEKHRRVLELSKELGLPTAAVESNFDELDQKSKQKAPDYAAIQRDTPSLARFMENPDNAILARDDRPHLENIEKKSRHMGNPAAADTFGSYLGDLYKAGKAGVHNATAGLHAMDAVFGKSNARDAAQQIWEQRQAAAKLKENRPNYQKEYDQMLEKEGGDVSRAWKQFTGSWNEMKEGNLIKALADYHEGGGKFTLQVIDFIWEGLIKRPRGAGVVITENLPQSAPAIVGGLTAFVNPVIGLAGTYAGSALTEIGGSILEDIEKSGADGPEAIEALLSDPAKVASYRSRALKKGLTTAAVDTAFALFAGSSIAKSAERSAAKAVAAPATGKVMWEGMEIGQKAVPVLKDVGVESVGEAVGEGTGQLVREDGDLSKVDIAGAVHEGIAGMGQSVAQTAIGSAVRKGYAKSTARAAEEVAKKTHDAVQAVEDQKTLEELAEDVKAMKTVPQVPGKLQEALDASAEPGEESKRVFFQSQDWDDHWTAKGESPAEKASEIMGDGGKSYLHSKSTGAPLAVPLGHLLEKTVQSGDFEGLKKSARLREGGPTLKEAEKYLREEMPEVMNELSKEASVRLEREKNFVPEEFHGRIQTELEAAGFEHVAKDYADALLKPFSTLHKRYGYDPKALVGRYKLSVQKGDANTATGGQTLEQGSDPQSFNQSSLSPLGFYSQVEREVEKMDFKEMPAKDLANRIANIQGIKKDELEQLGLIEWLGFRESNKDLSTLDGRPSARVTKEEVLAFIRNNGVKVEQVVRGENFEQRRGSRTQRVPGEFPLDTDLEWDSGEAQEPDDYYIQEEASTIITEYAGASYNSKEDDHAYFNDWSEKADEIFTEDILDDKDFVLSYEKDEDGDVADTVKLTWENGFPSGAEGVNFGKGKAGEQRLKKFKEKMEKALTEAFQDQAERAARERYWNDSDYVEYVFTESETGWTLSGRPGDGEWYSSETEKSYTGSISEAQIKLLDDMLEKGVIETQEMRSEREEEAENAPAVPAVEPEKKNLPTASAKFKSYKVAGGTNYREILLTLPTLNPPFTEGHWSEQNVLAHVRISDRVDAQGRKTLFVEELQSDWHQKGRERGYKNEADTQKHREALNRAGMLWQKAEPLLEKEDRLGFDTVIAAKQALIISDDFATRWEMSQQLADAISEWRNARFELDAIPNPESSIPDAPFKQTDAWAALAMKRILRLAVEEGYETVAWSPSEVQVERWGTDSISWTKKRGFEIYNTETGRASQRVDAFDTKEAAEADLKDGAFSEKWAVREHAEPFYLVGSVEQVGGRGDGTLDIEAESRRRGHLLEQRGTRVTTQEELRKVIADTLGRERNERSLESLTDTLWKQMQAKESGVKAPRKEGFEFFYDNLLPKKVVPGILKKLDKAAKVEVGQIDAPAVGENSANETGGQQAWQVAITEEMKQKVLGEGFSLFQEDQGDGTKPPPRGVIDIRGKQFDITLLKDADVSTFIHEMGHFYLAVLEDLSKDENAPPALKKDFQTIREWVGATEGQPFTREQHEMFARGFEQYLREGKVPTEAVRGAFGRLAAWLNVIYKSVKSLNIELTDEVRDVMDRLMATDEEIQAFKEQMAPFLPDPAALGLTGEKLVRHQKAVADWERLAKEKLRATLMKDMERVHEAEYLKKKEEIEILVDMELAALPVYRAWFALQKGTTPAGEALPEQIKLSRPLIDKEFGKNAWRKRLPRGITVKDGGLNPHEAANIFGFKSGGELLETLATTPPMAQAKERIVQQRMDELFPSVLDTAAAEEAVTAAFNDKQGELIRMELEFLASEHPGALKDLIRGVSKIVPSEKSVREQANKIVGGTAVGFIKPHVYAKLSAKAAKEAGEALAKGDIPALFEAKRRQLLNHELYRAAVAANEIVKKALPKFKKITDRKDDSIAKSRDMSLVTAARAILAGFGIGKSQDTVGDALGYIKQYAPEMHQTVLSLVENVPRGGGSYKVATMNDFVAMKEGVEAIWKLARDEKTITIDGKKQDMQIAIDELSGRMSELEEGKEKARYEKSKGDWDKTKIRLMGARAALRMIESWVDRMDNGNPQGPFRKYIWQPVSEAITQYRVAKKSMVQEYVALLDKIKPTLTWSQIAAPELINEKTGLGFRFEHKAQLLGALQHRGNLSNLSKLLRGYGWGGFNADGLLDRAKWDAFEKRMQKEGVLTKADYDFVQGVWNLNEKFKPDAQKAHYEMYGYYFNEITADAFETPWGSYPGGYVPAIADPFMAPDAAIRQEQESVTKNNNSFMFPTTGRGFTKSRVEEYAAPLTMDLRMVPASIDKVLRFIHIEPRVKDVGKLLWNKPFRKAIDAFDSTIAADMLVPWLQRSARQAVETPTQGKGGQMIDTVFREVRNRTSMQVLVGNVSNVMQQLTGWGPSLTKVKPKHLRNALWQFVRQPQATAAMVCEASPWMDNRLNNEIAKMNALADEILLNPSALETVQEFSKKHSFYLQAVTQQTVDVSTWVGKYNQAIEEGATHAEAVREADSAVRLTQGSGAPEDISRFETGSPFVRAFTMFFRYFNTIANLNATEHIKNVESLGLKKGAGRALFLYTFAFMAPAFLSEMIVRAMSGDMDEDDDDSVLDDVIESFFFSQIRFATAMVPAAGPAIMAGFNAVNSRWYDDRISTSPAISILESAIVGNAQNFYKTLTGQKVSGKKAIRDFLTGIGIVFGVPAAVLARPLGYLADVRAGKIEPSGVIDFTRGLMTGKGERKN